MLIAILFSRSEIQNFNGNDTRIQGIFHIYPSILSGSAFQYEATTYQIVSSGLRILSNKNYKKKKPHITKHYYQYNVTNLK